MAATNSAEPPARERRLQQQEGRERSGDREADHPPGADLLRRALLETSAWYSIGSVIPASRVRRSAATSPTLRPLTPGGDVHAARDRVALDRPPGRRTTRTSATWPSVMWPPPGRSISRFLTPSTLPRVLGAPWTMTSKTFCSSNTLPTWMPCNSVASARRTSPGVTPRACAFSRSTSISMVGCTSAAGDPRVDDAFDARHELQHLARPATAGSPGPARTAARRAACSSPVRTSTGRSPDGVRRRSSSAPTSRIFCVVYVDDFALTPSAPFDRVVDRGHGLVVVGTGLDADPDVARAHVHHPVAGHRPADVARRRWPRRAGRELAARPRWSLRSSTGSTPRADPPAGPARCGPGRSGIGDSPRNGSGATATMRPEPPAATTAAAGWPRTAGTHAA